MSRLLLSGGKRLSGDIFVGGSKNAALPILFSTIAIKGISEIRNLPKILDVYVAIRILRYLGADVRSLGDGVIIDTRELTYTRIPSELTCRVRASTYLIGACLARFGVVHLSDYGGCSFGKRPVDMHLSAAVALGAEFDGAILSAPCLSGGVIRFDKISVGATVNALIMSSAANGESRIYGYAKEPHVFSLIDFLSAAGADITVYDDYISVIGGKLHGSYSRIIPDMREAGTYLAISLATDSNLSVIGANADELSSFTDILRSGGAAFEVNGSCLRATAPLNAFLEITTGPYPEFPTDLQPVVAPLLALSCGGRIVETVWPERFNYLTELSRFGLKFLRTGSAAQIFPSHLISANASCPDLRGGIALLIAALAANGKSIIDSSELIDRGYENIAEKLNRVGAMIKQID